MEKIEIIKFENVSFGYGKTYLLENMNFPVYKNDFLGIVGPNGGGKTTLLKLILGFLKPQKGKITVFGKSPKKGRKGIGYLSQYKDVDFDFPITVEEIVSLSRIDKTGFNFFKEDDKMAVKKAMELMEISDIASKNLNEISGGQKQRVFLARALASEPKMLMLDEPMANLDIRIQEDFYRTLERLNNHIAIIIVDHDIDMVSKFAKEMICVNKCSRNAAKYHEIQSHKIKNICHV